MAGDDAEDIPRPNQLARIDNIILGILYTEFDEKFGPMPITWTPADLPYDMDRISFQSMSMFSSEGHELPKLLSVITIPTVPLTGLVKMFEYNDQRRRGKAAGCTLTLLFRDEDRYFLYKYIIYFEAIMERITTKIIHLAQTEPSLIPIALFDCYSDIIKVLRDMEIQDTIKRNSLMPPVQQEQMVRLAKELEALYVKNAVLEFESRIFKQQHEKK